jgi:hypothetical protein
VKIIFDSNENGVTARGLWDDRLQPVYAAIGNVKVKRASHVEPDRNGKWVADLAPVGGPQLGPYRLRQEALSAEVAWINKHHLRVG